MTTLSLAIQLVLLLLLIITAVRLSQQRRLLNELQAEQRDLSDAWRSHPVDFGKVPLSNSSPVIAVEILNPVELAVTEAPIAGPVNNFAPNMIKRIVYKRTVEIMREQLEERGVQAEIKIHGLG